MLRSALSLMTRSKPSALWSTMALRTQSTMTGNVSAAAVMKKNDVMGLLSLMRLPISSYKPLPTSPQPVVVDPFRRDPILKNMLPWNRNIQEPIGDLLKNVTPPLQAMNRNARKPKRANKGKRPCSHFGRRKRRRRFGNPKRGH